MQITLCINCLWMLSKLFAGFRRTFPVYLCEDKMSASTHTTSVESVRFSSGVAWISHLQSACGTEALLCHVNINLHLPESLLWPMVLSFYIQLVFVMKKDWRRNHNYAYPNMSLNLTSALEHNSIWSSPCVETVSHHELIKANPRYCPYIYIYIICTYYNI